MYPSIVFIRTKSPSYSKEYVLSYDLYLDMFLRKSTGNVIPVRKNTNARQP